MSALVERAYAKLNLALHVRGKLPDGRHALETIFAFCEDGDELRAEPSDGFSLAIEGPFGLDLECDKPTSVEIAADRLVAAADGPLGAAMTLDKRLPIASGLGGGSADAAATLRLLTELWGVDQGIATAVAPGIGADVPACLQSRTCRGTGAGDQLELIDLPELRGTAVLLVNPLVPLSTRDVFERWDGVDHGSLGDWREGRNDLEAPAIALVPEIASVLEWLRARPGATFVRMSGSGATCFALFDSAEALDSTAALVPASWWHLATKLR